MKPIFIVSPSGRSGTTFLAEKLSLSDKIICDQEYPYENFIANYYVKLSKVIATNGMFDIYPKYGSPNLLIGPYPDSLQSSNKAILYEKLTKNFKLSTKKLIENYYKDYAIIEKKISAEYFVEKFGHFLLDEAESIFLNDLKILIMIRNPLEIYDSIKKFNLKRGYRSFGMEHYERDEDYLIKSFIPQLLSVYNNYALFNKNIYLVEYNSLMNNTIDEFKNIFKYLNIDFNESSILSSNKNNDLHKTTNMKSLLTDKEKTIINKTINNNEILKKLYGNK